jgi:uncharacterized repeat protein (TIGR01451 family)
MIYTITVHNAGPAAATGVTVTDMLSPSLSLVSATSSQGTCSGTTVVTCNLGGLASGSSANIQFIVRAGTTETVSNTASVRANESDPDPSNNSSTFIASVGGGTTIPLLSPRAEWLLAVFLAAAALIALRRARWALNRYRR